MSEPLLNVLKICLLVLLYLFFLRVLQAVWSEVNGPRRTQRGRRGRTGDHSRAAESVPGRATKRVALAGGRSAARGPAGLTVVEPPDEAGRTYPLGDEITVGRAAGCQVTLDDTYVSQLHARIFQRDGELFVEDLGSTNGTYLNRTKVSGPMAMKSGDRLQVGSVVMELT
ncbi:MAG: FHA domain-containing protein [Acidimicrobiales bacterium]|nr:FHA domain-containing protein [Acidimicrobiales bacterium]